jgi:hypothetical protein
MGFVAKVGGLIAAHQYWALIPLFLIGLVAAVRKFGAKWFGGFFGTGRGGAVLMLIGCFGGALFLAITSGLTGFAQVTIAALGILVTAYPLLKIIGNLVSGTAEAQTVENALVAVGKDAAVNPIAPVAPADLAKAVADAKATGFVADPKLSATDIANAATKP